MTGIGLVSAQLITSASVGLSGHANLTCNFHAFSDERQAEFESVIIEGFYSHGFEKSDFRPIDSEKTWWVFSHKLKELLEASEAYRLRVEVRGMLSPLGKYGHLLGYDRCLTQVVVLKVVDTDSNIRLRARRWNVTAHPNHTTNSIR